MPCRDFYDDHPEQYFKDITEPALKKQIAFAESALCAALDALDRIEPRPLARGRVNTFDMIDYESAGITKDALIEWRKAHLFLDKKHKEEEAKKLRESALSKLTPEEKKILGVK